MYGVGMKGRAWVFQSSPALSGRCNRFGLPKDDETLMFQSSPALSGRCNGAGFGTIVLAFLRFNPHRPFRAGATSSRPVIPRGASSFNPHRPFRAGATDQQYKNIKARLKVSILTGPFGPVQRHDILWRRRDNDCFNPHRPFRAGATRAAPKHGRIGRCFNPHRPFRAGATTCIALHTSPPL